MGTNSSEFYAAQEQVRNEQVDVTTTSSKIMEATFKGYPRKQYVIRNTSNNVLDIITISKGNNAAVSKEGIVLEKGETYLESTITVPAKDVWQGNIHAICETANGKLSITED